MSETIVLASASPFRRKMLADAGVAFEFAPARIDERTVEATLAGSGATPQDLAQVLAEAKAADVSGRQPGRLVLGCDQVLSFGVEILHKPADMDAARRRLIALSGSTHHLNSGVALVRDGQTLWRHVEVAAMTMRAFDAAFVGKHLARVGGGVLQSVGAYQIEGQGVQLFDTIEGDYFTIIGLPLLPLLKALRGLGALDG